MILDIPAPCAICGAPRSAAQAAKSIVCANALCDWKLRATPPERRCVECGRPLNNDQLASRVCAQARCRQTHLVDRPAAARRAGRLAVLSQGRELRTRAALDHKIADADSYRVTVVPRNHDQTRPLAARRRHRFAAHLRSMIDRAREQQAQVASGAAQPAPPLPPIVPPAKPLGDVMLQACIACRGFCCRTGGEHAYITPETMREYRRLNPDVSTEAMVSDYLSYLPTRSLPHGCVFQHAKGCTLPRDMRGDTCNRYYCEALTQLEREVQYDPSPNAFFIATNDAFFSRAVFAAPDFVQLVRARATSTGNPSNA